MSWWKRAQDSQPPVASSEVLPGSRVERQPANDIGTATGSADGDAALDTVVTFLQVYGGMAFDTDVRDCQELRDSCDRWASKIAIGDPLSRARGPEFRRDWVGVRRFVEEQRQQEVLFVTKSLGTLRATVGDFANCLGTTITQEREADGRLEAELVALGSALNTSDIAQIRQRTMRVISMVESAIGRRRTREERQIKRLAQRLQQLTSELNVARERASLDPLTRVYNRGAFDEQLMRLSELGLFYGSPPILLLVDLDQFKNINDQFGHTAGDSVLKQLGDTLIRTFLRKQDFVCRYGGDEFAVLIVETPAADAERLADRVLGATRSSPVAYAGRDIPVTVSLGVAIAKPGESSADWLARADQALYRAKQAGRNRSCLAE